MPRNKGWFRVYDRMLDSPDILELNDSEFRVIISIWCLASQGGTEDGRIGYKNGALWRRVAPQMKKDSFEGILSHLVGMGLILGEDGEYFVKDWGKHQYLYDSKKPSVRKLNEKPSSTHREVIGKSSGSKRETIGQQDSDSDTDSETDTEKDTTHVGHDPVPYERLRSLWNEIVVPKGAPEVRALSKGRKAHIKARWNEKHENLETLEDWDKFFRWIASDCGNVCAKPWWSFDFVFKSETNLLKCLEGNYMDDKIRR